MMDSTITSTVEELSFDGPIRFFAAVIVVAAAMLLFAWALKRESSVLGRNSAISFWVLRSVAVATVVWMLLAPVNVRVQTSKTRKGIVFVTDVSGSMRITDPPGKGDDLRWTMAQRRSPPYVATQSADRSAAAVRVATRRLDAAIEALKQRKPESEVVSETKAADEALSEVRKHLEFIRDATDQREKHSRTNSIADGLIRSFSDAEFDAFHRLSVALQKGRTPSQKGWRESLPDLSYRIASLTRTINELARQVESEETESVAKQQPRLLDATVAQPRLRRATGLIERLNKTALEPVHEKADVIFGVFDSSVHRLGDQQDPAANLRSQFADTEKGSTSGKAVTNVSTVLEELNRWRQEGPLAAVFMLTDMAHNDTNGLSPRDVASSIHNTPIYVVPIGNTQHVRDIALQNVSAPSVAMRNDQIVIEATVQAYDCDGEVCTVQLLRDGNVIDFREVVLDSNFAKRSVRFERKTPEIGMQKFQVAVVPLDGEQTEENNFDEFDVNVTRSDVKILLADEFSRWEQRYLAQLFRRHEKIDCDELLYHPRMIATGHRAATGTMPVTVDDWNQYDVVLLGDLPVEHFSVESQRSMIQYMEKRGGTVVVIAGGESMPHAYENHPLESVLPVRQVIDPVSVGPSGYAFRVTELGRAHDALLIGHTDEATRVAWDFVNQFSPLHSLSPWRQPKPSARTLISAVPRDAHDQKAAMKSNAFLCWQPIGRGRLVYLSGPDTYRLRFLRGDTLHDRFWGQLIRWSIASDLAAGSEFVRIRTEKSRYDSRESVRATVQLVDQQGEPVSEQQLHVRVTATDYEHLVPLIHDADVPGKYSAVVGELPPGVYRIEPIGDAIDALQAETALDRASSSFTVKEDLPLELVDTRCDRALAGQIANITGGQVIPPTAIDEILKLTDLEPIVTEKVQRQPLWVRWEFLFLVLGCLQLEWIIRKWKGFS